MKRFVPVIGIAVASLWVWTAVPSVASGTIAPGGRQGAQVVEPLGTTLFKKFSSSAGLGTTVRISADGNVFGFASPKDVDHIDAGAIVAEGYVLCYKDPHTQNPVDAYDVADKASGFGVSTHTASPVAVTRTTTDGNLRLTQTFTFDGLGRSLRVTMSVKNLSGVSISGVSLRRQVDIDADTGGTDGTGNFNNRFGATSASVFAYNDSGGGPTVIPGAHGLMMRVLAAKGLFVLFPGATGTIDDTSCSPSIDPTPLGPADEGASYSVLGATLPAGATWSEIIEYDAF